MSARTPEHPPPPDPRALLVVVDAARRVTGGREDLAGAARLHPGAHDLEPQVLRRTVDSYVDALEGFRVPAPSPGYILAAFWTLRKRVALWLGLPALVLAAIAFVAWGIPAWQESVDKEERRAELNVRVRYFRELDEQVRTELKELDAGLAALNPPPLNQAKVWKRLQEHHHDLTTAELETSEINPNATMSSQAMRRLGRAFSEEARALDQLKGDLAETQRQLLLAPGLWSTQRRLDNALGQQEGLTMPESLRERIRTAHRRGTLALIEGNDTEATECAAEIFGYLDQAREAAAFPAKLDEILARIKGLALEPSVLAEAETLRRDATGSELDALQGVRRRLMRMEERLREEYTLVISGGKWRFKNNNPSNKSYYVLVEAVTPDGRKLQRTIKNEEDRSSTTVSIWGERVPFEVYERVRKDKQDDGVIQDNVFGRKQRGRMEEEVTILSDEGRPLPRAGQITRW